MPKISKIHAREILDSRGNPTLETTVFLDSGHLGVAAVPSGTAAGNNESIELRDQDPNRFHGLGVLKAVEIINQLINPKITGFDPSQQTLLDQALIDLDGTIDKSKLGGNSILSVSIAVLKAAAAAYNLPLYLYLSQKYGLNPDSKHIPAPIFNIINGGRHGAGNLDFQEFQIIPSLRFPFNEALRLGDEIYKNLKLTLESRHLIHSVGDEGGYAPNLFTNLDALEVILESTHNTPYKIAQDVFLGLDVAADFFYDNKHYPIKDRAQPFNRDELITYYRQLNQEYHLFSLEDPLEANDWEGWTKLTAELSSNTLIIGDDLLCTNKKIINKAIATNACNAILIKPNQPGTISETIEVIKLCRQNNWKIIVSHRSGETNDTFIADFAVGVGSDYTKFGAPARGERVAKYNRLLTIETEINGH